MGVYAFGTSAGFMLAFIILGEMVKRDRDEWRPAWFGIGLTVLILGACSAALVRNRALQTEPEFKSSSNADEHSFTFWQAIASPVFWTFTIAISFYGLIVAGTSLFNESILAERGFDKAVFVTITQFGVPVGLGTT